MQTQMEEKVSVPRTQEAFQNMDEIYAMVSRSILVQEHVHRIRKSRSADSTISRLENNNEHRALANSRMNRSFGKKVGPEVSNLTSGSCMEGDLASPVGAGETGTRRLVESEHVVVDLCAAMQSPDDQILVASRKKNHPEDKLGAAVKGFTMMKEPSFPIYLKFSDVGYKIGNGGRPRTVAMEHILQGVTGSVKPEEILVLMGPSGGGKTTLLNLLSGRLKSKGHGGSITYNGRPYSKSLKRRIGFVLQDDVVFPHLTVRETLTYAALLRLPKTLTKQQKEERVRRVIFDLGLERCQDTIVGGARTRGVSGGERKRVCIGNEILLDPSLLFLDEPTSGLDSTTALRIVQMLHSIAHAGKTVVTTIHQPSSRMFNMFDKLILLGKGSSLYYGKASEAMLYFSSIGCSPLIPMNPAEFLIDLANGNLNDKSVSHEIKCHDTRSPSSADIHRYLLGAYETRLSGEKKQKTLMPPAIDTKWMVQGGACSNESAVSWLEQCYILFCRGLRERRHEYLSYIRVIQVIATAIIIGLLWWQSDSSSPKSLQDQAGLLFFISVFWGYFPVFAAIFTFPKERAMLAKERAVDMYRLSAYFIARTLSDLPLDLILPSVFLLIVYFMAGLRSDFTAFLESVLTVLLSIVAAQGLGLAVGAAMMDIKKATTLASVIIMTFMLAGGFFIQRVPFLMTWIRYLSFNYHAYRLLLKAQYGCAAGASHGGTNPCNSPFIEGLGLDDGGMEIRAMVAMAFGYRLLAYLFLRKMKIQS